MERERERERLTLNYPFQVKEEMKGRELKEKLSQKKGLDIQTLRVCEFIQGERERERERERENL